VPYLPIGAPSASAANMASTGRAGGIPLAAELQKRLKAAGLDLQAPTRGDTSKLGKDWVFLEILYRIYSTAGYNIAHVDAESWTKTRIKCLKLHKMRHLCALAARSC
jgi:hypothetical protein